MLALLLVVGLVFFIGCAASQVAQPMQETADTKAAGEKRITGLDTHAEADLINVTLRGNRFLEYTSIKQPSPLAVILYFPETDIGDVAPEYALNEDPLQSVKISPFSEQMTTARVEIALAQDVPYVVSREGNDLKIAFTKIGADAPLSPLQGAPPPNPAPTEPIAQPAKKSESQTRPAASRLVSVSTAQADQHVSVIFTADGTVNDYKFFTMKRPSPARIVYDFFGIQGSSKQEQFIPVDSPWISRVRYYTHPEKIRLVIDTQPAFLSQFDSHPIENGLAINVGPTAKSMTVAQAAAEPQSAPQSVAARSAPEPASARPARINRIDFTNEKDGKSTISVGTTQTVRFKVEKVSATHLNLKLFNTQLPKHQQRPLITSRFESAVDRITPLQTPEMQTTSLVMIKLRQSVPYFVDQTDNVLNVRFEASTIPPKPLEQAQLAPWKQALEQGVSPTGGVPMLSETGAAASMATQAKKEYAGEKIALDFFETDIKNVFRILMEVSGKNFAIDKNVGGKVTLTFEKPVPWDQVLDLILQMNQLGQVTDGEIIRIATLETLKAEEDLRRLNIEAAMKAKEQELELQPLMTEYIPINYSNAKTDILPHLEKISTKERGTLSVDERTNLIIMTDIAEKIVQAKEIVNELDKVTPQVIIESRIVEAASNFSRELGVQWNLNIGPAQKDSLGGVYNYDTAMNFPITASTAGSGTIGFNFLRLAGTPFELNARLMAMESRGEGKIISTPKIATLDNKKATIKQGLRYPYNKLDDSGNTVTVFEDIDLVLEVTPHVTPDGRISMYLRIEKNDLGNIINNQQSFTTKEAETELLVNDGDTVVIGGIIKTTKRSADTGFPFLKDIPVLGWLFKVDNQLDDKEELLIFITPRIVQFEQRRVQS